MTKDTGFFTCKNICWIIGTLFGFALFLMISGIIGLIIGIAVAIGLAIFLQKVFCSDVTSTAVGEIAQAGDDATSDERGSDEVAASAASIPAAAMDGAPVPVEAAAAPQAPAEKTDAKPAAKKPAAKKTVSDTPVAKKATPKGSAAKAAKPAAAAPTGQPNKPHTMDAPRASGADDLKQLKGVGPKLEQTLNELGFWHFDQIAKWGPDEIAWVDDNLSFKGRIERDGWVEQAKTLAEGGETAFSKKVKKGDVY
ncbi:NADH:quinone oxidoreductase [Aliiroseovarius sp. S2029]|uniref:NADH:quinone oxidoreductase n=1 Tax=Aliiroseovarius sp. S2029 TaxID=2936988 RepID=UPI0020C00411|nr:NADH:quinone oxidoreductase [Aliiroseovarius sp. S2029]MCK8484824.1 NADH:quinone oxidoreductase [Aliiroseovarius sp. S2029]